MPESKLDIKDIRFTINLRPNTSVDSYAVKTFLERLHTLHAVYPLKSLLVKDGPTPNEYDYDVEFKDGRKGSFLLIHDGAGNFTFSLNTFGTQWSIAQFGAHLTFRESVFLLIFQEGLTRLDVRISP